MLRTCEISKMEVSNKDQHVIEMSIYQRIFLLFDSKRAMINVPIGIEKMMGVRAARPIRPYPCQILMILLLREVKSFFFGLFFNT